MPSNEQPYQIQLRVCNEKAPAGCTLSGQQSAQSYGRLEGMLSEIGAPAVNGKSVTWTVTGSSNGDATQLHYRIDGGAEQVLNIPETGTFSRNITGTTADFNEDIRLEVWLRDNAPAGRGEAYRDNEATSGVPAAGVTVLNPDRPCNDGNPEGNDNCWDGKDLPPCEASSCWFVTFTVSSFYNAYSCSISNTGLSKSFGFTVSGNNPRGASVTHTTSWYAKQAPTVTCGTGGFFPQSSSDTADDWPTR